MKIQDMLDMVNELVPNTLDSSMLMGFLNDCETTIHSEVFMTHEGTDQVTFDGYGSHTPSDTELLLGAPHHNVYRWYLEMQIHQANQETARYNNAAAQFNAAYLTMADYYNRHYMPKGISTPRYW